MRQIYPTASADLEVTTVAGTGPLPEAVACVAPLYRNEAASTSAVASGRAVVRANMIASADGAVTLDGRSGGLSGPADRMIFKLLRSVADVVLVGAGTARTERYRPVQPADLWAELRPSQAAPPPIAVVTASLDLSTCDRLLGMPPGPSQTIVITTAAAPADRKTTLARRARVIEAGERAVDVTAAVAALADLGYRNILTEGGPTLLGQLVAAGALDELCLTTSPLLAGGRAGRIAAGPPATQRMSLAHVLADGDYLLSRYTIRPAG